MKFQTAVLHAGNKELEKYGATLPPVYQSGAFEQKSAEGLAKIFDNKAPGYCYTRVANPTTAAFEMRITKLDGVSCLRIWDGSYNQFFFKYPPIWR